MQPKLNILWWQWAHLWMLICICKCLSASAMPQDPLELIAGGIMTAASSAMDMVQKGVALRKDFNFDIPFGGANSKTEIGFGEAIVMRQSSEDDSDEDRRRRRKRAVAVDHPDLHRGKRSPCFTGGGQPANPTPAGGADEEEIARRRAQRRRKAAARRRSQNSTTTARKNKNTKRFTDANEFHSRRRRQAAEMDVTEEAKTLGQKISEHAKQAVEKFRSFWGKVVNTATQVAQNLKATFSGATNGSTGGDSLPYGNVTN